MHIRKAAAFLFLILATVVGAAAAQTKPQVTSLSPAPKTVIYVGNSFFYFNDSMHRYVLGLIAQGDPQSRGQYRQTSVTISGSGLNWHDVEAYLKPGGGMASYSFTADNRVVFNKFDRPFDAIIMNDCSQCPVHPQLKDTFHEYARRHSQTARKYGAAPILFMTWAYQDKPEMTAQLAEEYTVAGNANGALVIPAGLAFARAVAKNPALNLYYTDKRHPSLAGTYLGAATIYAALYGKSPAGLKYTGGLDEKTATFLQEVAWDTVREYYAK
jgi:hypothetical protein